MPGSRQQAERALRICGALLLAGLAAGCFFVASREWFHGDDFSFLHHVREAPFWSWWWPFGERHWPFYRPLGMHSYYWACLRAFGLSPLLFLSVGLACGVAASVSAGGIARRMGLSPPAAAITSLTLLSVLAGTGVLTSATTFHYVAALLASCVALSLFLDDTPARLAASAAALSLGLLCNEIAALVPLAALGLAWTRAPDSGMGLRRVVPLAGVVVLYLLLRSIAVSSGELPGFYETDLGWNVPRNAALQLTHLLGDAPRSLAVLSLAGCLLWAGGRSNRPQARLLASCGVWVVAGLVPFSLLAVPAPRFSLACALPAALALGAVVEHFWTAQADARPRRAALVIAVLALALLPVETLARQARSPGGALPERLHDILTAQVLPDRTTWFLVLYGVPGLADESVVEGLAWHLYGRGQVFTQALFPEREGIRPVRMRFVDGARTRRLPRSMEHCVYLAVRANGSVDLANPPTVRALLPGLRGRCVVSKRG